MSQAFDLAQQAIKHLLGDNPTAQDDDIAHYLCKMVSAWHDYSHQNSDCLNRLVGKTSSLLSTALRYEDDEERLQWLRARL